MSVSPCDMIQHILYNVKLIFLVNHVRHDVIHTPHALVAFPPALMQVGKLERYTNEVFSSIPAEVNSPHHCLHKLKWSQRI